MAPALHPVLGSRMFLKSDSHLKELLGKVLTSPVLLAAPLASAVCQARPGWMPGLLGVLSSHWKAPAFLLLLFVVVVTTLYRPGWPKTQGNSPVSAFYMLWGCRHAPPYPAGILIHFFFFF